MKNLKAFWTQTLAAGGSIAVSAGPWGIFRLQISQSPVPHEWPHYAIQTIPDGDEATSDAPEEGTLQVSSGGAVMTVNATDDIAKFSFELKGAEGVVHMRGATPASCTFGGEKIRLAFEIPDGRQYYGFGAFGENVPRVPGRYRCWNTDDHHHQPLRQPYTAIPFGMTLAPRGAASCGVFVNNPGEVTFDLALTSPNLGIIECATGDLDLWLFPAATPAEVLKQWTAMTGRMERPPVWSLGMQQSRWSYMNSEEVLDIAKQFRARQIPLDVIHLDIHYMDGYRVFTWDENAFGDPEALTDELAKLGVQIITIVDPGVKVDPTYKIYVDGLEKDVFLRHATGVPVLAHVWPGESVHPDFTNARVRQWWAEQHKVLTDAGVRGIWCDMNEPAVWGTSVSLHDYAPDAVHHDEGGFRKHREIHNVYGHLMSLAAREGLLQARPEERPFVLTRSGWAGMQRHAAIWTGDNRSSFGSMNIDIVHLLSLGVSGVPFAGSDIGGFQNDGFAELYTRWMEWGVFQPFCRAHSALNTLRQEPWSFGEGCEDFSRTLISYRMSLLPYLYTQFVEAENSGMPIMRPLFLEFPEDPVARRISDQFMVGPDILVAPVLESGRDRRLVYLPEGGWYRAGEWIDGGRWIVSEMPLGSLPIFIRAGAAIPQAPIRMHTGEPITELQFTIYVGPEIKGRIVEDDGISFAYRTGCQSVRQVTGRETEDGFELQLSAVQGDFDPAAGLPDGRALTMRIVAPRPVGHFAVNGETTDHDAFADAFRAALKAPGAAVRVEGFYD